MAIGRVREGDLYPVKMGNFQAYRVDVDYLTAKQADIHPLLDQLELTKDLGNKWGVSVRTSKRRLVKSDAKRIAKAMQADLSPIDV